MSFEEIEAGEKLGAFITRIRENRGLSVEELSETTKVNKDYIRSIEAGDWKAFPVPAYVKGYLQSICYKLNLNKDQVLKAFANESGAPRSSDLADFAEKKVVVKEGEPKKKNMVVPVVLLLLVIAFLVVSHFLDLESVTQNFSQKNTSEVSAVDTLVEEPIEATEIPEGAEIVPVDSLAKDSTNADSLVAPQNSSDSSVSQAVVDEAVKKSDLPASATIFISSDSKTEAIDETPKTNKTEFLLVGSGEALSWVGLKRSENASNFLKEANIAKAGVKMYYKTTDTLNVVIGDPKAIAKMYLNGKETALPEMRSGRVTRFKVYGGKIVR